MCRAEHRPLAVGTAECKRGRVGGLQLRSPTSVADLGQSALEAASHEVHLTSKLHCELRCRP